MTFQYIVKNLGFVDGVDVNLRTDIQFNLMAPTFESSSADYVTLFEPVATEFVSSGKGYIVASVGEYSGEIPYTSFIALESFLNEQPEKAKKFVKALYKAIKYVETTPSTEVAKELVKHFKGADIEATANSLDNYKSVDTWMSHLGLTEPMFNTLLSVISNAGESVEGVKYSDIAYNKIANEVYLELYG